VISSERDKIMATTRQKADTVAKTFGVEIVDVRLRRVELPPDVTDPVYARMESERRRVANELRSVGQADSEKIRADADRQREVIIAEAYRQAQKIKGEGDAKAAAIYAAAFGANPEFFAFYRSLEAYRSTFRGRNDMLVLDPSSTFSAISGARRTRRSATLTAQPNRLSRVMGWRIRCGRRLRWCSSSKGCCRSSHQRCGATAFKARLLGMTAIAFISSISIIMGRRLLARSPCVSGSCPNTSRISCRPKPNGWNRCVACCSIISARTVSGSCNHRSSSISIRS
jgi:hypothetical protein